MDIQEDKWKGFLVEVDGESLQTCFSLLFFTTIVKNNNIFLLPSFVLSCCAILENKIIGKTFSTFCSSYEQKLPLAGDVIVI